MLINTHVYDYLLKDFSLKLAYNTNHMMLTQLALRILYQLICSLYVQNNIYLHCVRLLKLIRGGLQHNTNIIQILSYVSELIKFVNKKKRKKNSSADFE